MIKNYSAVELSEIKFRYQATLVCLIVCFLLGAWFLYLGHTPLIGLGCFVAYILSIVFGFLLVSKVSSTTFGVLMIILICLPLIGLIPVIFVLIKATLVLRNQKDIPAAAQVMSSTGRLSSEEIYRIAACQKKVIFCLLASMLLSFSQFMLPPELMALIKLAALVAWVASIVFTFMLAQSVYKRNLGIVMGILTLIPIVNIIPILKVSGNATSLLREEGVRVGFFGARL